MKAILASGKYGQRNLVLFDRDQYSLSNLRFKTVKLRDVLEISRGRVIVKERLAMKEQKRPNTIRSSFRTNCESDSWLCSIRISWAVASTRLQQVFVSKSKGADTPLTRQSLWRIIHEAGTAVGLKKLVPIRCVRPLAILYKQGTKTEIIQSLLNHSSQRETLRYWNHPGRQRYCSKEFGFMTE